eukprot:gene6357-4582_t
MSQFTHLQRYKGEKTGSTRWGGEEPAAVIQYRFKKELQLSNARIKKENPKNTSYIYLMAHKYVRIEKGGGGATTHDPTEEASRHFAQILLSVDFTDAFRRVTPQQIHASLYRKHVPTYIIRWILSYLTDRRIYVWACSRASRTAPTAVGCPQGSILGPFLWLLVMDDLLSTLDTFRDLATLAYYNAPQPNDPELIRSLRRACARLHLDGSPPPLWTPPLPAKKILLGPLIDFGAYADDLSVWITAPTPQLAAAATQLVLTVISDWTLCHGIQISTKTEARWISHGPYIYILLPPPDRASSAIRLLGLYIDPTLTFTTQIRHLIATVSTRLHTLRLLHPYMAPSLRHVVLTSTCHSRILYALHTYWDLLSSTSQQSIITLWSSVAIDITGCMATTATDALLQASDCRPLSTEVELARLGYWQRLLFLPPMWLNFFTATTGEVRPPRAGSLAMMRSAFLTQPLRCTLRSALIVDLFCRCPPHRRDPARALPDNLISSPPSATILWRHCCNSLENAWEKAQGVSSSLPELRSFNTTVQYQRTPPPDYDLYTDGSVKPLEASSSRLHPSRPSRPRLSTDDGPRFDLPYWQDNWPAGTPHNASPSLRGSGLLLLIKRKSVPCVLSGDWETPNGIKR